MFGLTEFLATLSEEQLAVFEYIDKQLLDLGLTRKIRYKVPFYDHHKWMCYINPQKNGNLELCFLEGRQLLKVNPALNSKKRKMVAGYEIIVHEDIDIDLIMEIVQNAMTLQSVKKITP